MAGRVARKRDVQRIVDWNSVSPSVGGSAGKLMLAGEGGLANCRVAPCESLGLRHPLRLPTLRVGIHLPQHSLRSRGEETDP